jgi:2-polyprenyl-6-methoxyphenol hydroxylase-like FAD-dependent oxidoreductase
VIEDAIHVMSPCGGVGAVTALVDGAKLAHTIAVKGISTESIGEFEKAMREFSGANIRRSYIGGRKLFGQKTFEECSQYVE